MTTRFIEVRVNCPDSQTAERIAVSCVDARLAACANLLPSVDSVYRWQGEIERGREVSLVLTSRADLFDKLSVQIRTLHPYDTPAIVASELILVDNDTATWLIHETKEA